MIPDAGRFAKRTVWWAAPASRGIMPHVGMDRFFVMAGSIIGLLGVGLGAFGAHSLRGHFKDHADLEAIYRTATEYQMVRNYLPQMVDAVGGDFFLRKPFDARLLIKLINEILIRWHISPASHSFLPGLIR